MMEPTPEPYCDGDRVYLRQVSAADAETIAAWKSDPFIRKMALDPDVDPSPSRQRQDIAQAIASGDELYLMVVLKAAGEPIGTVRINWLDKQRSHAWLRFALGRERGQGHAKDALRAFLGRILADGVHRVEAETYEYNSAALGLLSGLGFQREGLKRKAHWDGREHWDVVVLGLLATDFQAGA
jgi:ribosomal-protein-alanine N-acetyltransferase